MYARSRRNARTHREVQTDSDPKIQSIPVREISGATDQDALQVVLAPGGTGSDRASKLSACCAVGVAAPTENTSDLRVTTYARGVYFQPYGCF